MGGILHKKRRSHSPDADETIECNVYFIEMLYIFRHFSSFLCNNLLITVIFYAIATSCFVLRSKVSRIFYFHFD